jgi:hypothetical protein
VLSIASEEIRKACQSPRRICLFLIQSALRSRAINPEVDHGSPRRLRWPVKVVPRVCIVDGIGHSRNFLEATLEEPDFTTRACTQVGEPDRALAGLPPMTP